MQSYDRGNRNISGVAFSPVLLAAELGLVACVGALFLTIGTMARRIPAFDACYALCPDGTQRSKSLFAGFILILYKVWLFMESTACDTDSSAILRYSRLWM